MCFHYQNFPLRFITFPSPILSLKNNILYGEIFLVLIMVNVLFYALYLKIIGLEKSLNPRYIPKIFCHEKILVLFCAFYLAFLRSSC